MSSTTTSTKSDSTITIHRIARAWNAFVASIASLALAGIISILLGLNSLPQSIPLVALVHTQPVWALGFCVVFVGITIFSFLIVRRGENPQPIHHNDNQSKIRLPRFALPTIISTVSFALFATLLTTVLVRPSWCPAALCPPPSIVYAHNSVHDSNLEIYYTDQQTDYYAIPGNPSQYNATNAPHSIGVVRLDKAATQSYRILFTLHNVRRTGYAIIIEQMTVNIVDVPITPQPLNVWYEEPIQYLIYPYVATYSGQTPGTAVLAAVDTSDPSFPSSPSFLELASGEADTVGLQITSTRLADVRFSISVRYRIANEGTLFPPLTLPENFEVIFTDGSNWHLYTLAGSHFTPSP